MTTQTRHCPDSLRDAPLSARTLWLALSVSENHRQTVPEVRQTTGMGYDALRRATEELRDRDLLETSWCEDDPRVKRLELTTATP